MNVTDYANDSIRCEQKIQVLLDKKLLFRQSYAPTLCSAHLEKAYHNLRFVHLIEKNEEYLDWAIVGLYYAVYHASLALIANKGYISKHHLGTLLVLIKEYTLSDHEVTLLEQLTISKEDIQAYTMLKEKRRQASYSTNIVYLQDDFKKLKTRSIDFLSKAKNLLEGQKTHNL